MSTKYLCRLIARNISNCTLKRNLSSTGEAGRGRDAGSILFINPSDQGKQAITTAEMLEQFMKVAGATTQYDSPATIEAALDKRKKLMELLPSSQAELPSRSMKDSFVTVRVPLTENHLLRERYITSFGTLRIGRLLEELDVFAVWCCYNHILNPKSEGLSNPYSVVTALVDSIHFSGHSIQTDKDIRMSGHVSWVGKSSMEVSVLVDQQLPSGEWSKLTNAVFVLVARDPLNKGSAIINPLATETPEEAAYIARGKDRSVQRKRFSEESLQSNPPNEEERALVHDLFSSTMTSGFRSGIRQKPSLSNETVPMADSALKTLLLCHPQYRNRFNKIFGGFIMRQAFELAFSNVYLYAKARPKIINIDDIIFRKPVEIGSILRFEAEIGYVEKNYVHAPVIAEVTNPETGETDVTNVFHFTFQTESDPPKILPHTYIESMLYLDSRRHFKEMMKNQELFNA